MILRSFKYSSFSYFHDINSHTIGKYNDISYNYYSYVIKKGNSFTLCRKDTSRIINTYWL